MKCPVCKDTNLVMADRQGVEIDYCPDCRGVWLDRGELDKIIEKSSSQELSNNDNNEQQNPYPQQQQYGYGKHHGGGYGKHGGYDRYGRNRGFLSRIFDFH